MFYLPHPTPLLLLRSYLFHTSQFVPFILLFNTSSGNLASAEILVSPSEKVHILLRKQHDSNVFLRTFFHTGVSYSYSFNLSGLVLPLKEEKKSSSCSSNFTVSDISFMLTFSSFIITVFKTYHFLLLFQSGEACFHFSLFCFLLTSKK